MATKKVSKQAVTKKVSKQAVIATLKRAQNLVRNVGWCQYTGKMLDSYGNVAAYCILGAVYADVDNTRQREVAREARDALKSTLNVRYLASYNDHSGRTRGDVLRAFTKTIRNLEKGKTNA